MKKKCEYTYITVIQHFATIKKRKLHDRYEVGGVWCAEI